jgi:hypothetical protein
MESILFRPGRIDLFVVLGDYWGVLDKQRIIGFPVNVYCPDFSKEFCGKIFGVHYVGSSRTRIHQVDPPGIEVQYAQRFIENTVEEIGKVICFVCSADDIIEDGERLCLALQRRFGILAAGNINEVLEQFFPAVDMDLCN